MQLLAICGSLRAASSNYSLLLAAAKLAPENVEVQLYEQMSELPHFNPDQEIFEVVVQLKQAVKDADGVLFCTPEYAHGLPGSFKNLLDHLVSDGELWDKPVSVLSARKCEFAEPQLHEILRTLMARICEEASIVVPLRSNKTGVEEIVATPELAEPLREAMKGFTAFVQENSASQERATA